MKFNLDFKATWIFHRWIIFTMSHSWVLNIIIFSSLNIIILSGHLERFSWKILLNASLIAPSGCGLFVWIIHAFASIHHTWYAWISQHHLKFKSLHMQACFMVSFNRMGINFVSSYEEVVHVVCLDLFFCHKLVSVNEKSMTVSV